MDDPNEDSSAVFWAENPISDDALVGGGGAPNLSTIVLDSPEALHHNLWDRFVEFIRVNWSVVSKFGTVKSKQLSRSIENVRLDAQQNPALAASLGAIAGMLIFVLFCVIFFKYKRRYAERRPLLGRTFSADDSIIDPNEAAKRIKEMRRKLKRKSTRFSVDLDKFAADIHQIEETSRTDHSSNDVSTTGNSQGIQRSKSASSPNDVSGKADLCRSVSMPIDWIEEDLEHVLFDERTVSRSNSIVSSTFIRPYPTGSSRRNEDNYDTFSTTTSVSYPPPPSLSSPPALVISCRHSKWQNHISGSRVEDSEDSSVSGYGSETGCITPELTV